MPTDGHKTETVKGDGEHLGIRRKEQARETVDLGYCDHRSYYNRWYQRLQSSCRISKPI